MNVNDTEIVSSVLAAGGFELTSEINNADAILLNTCSVRDNAEKRITARLKHLKPYKKKKPDLLLGILGCMAERLRAKLLENNSLLDLVVGPDEYRKIDSLIEKAFDGEKGIAVRLSKIETYDDIPPLRKSGLSAYLSIMRGCNNFCSYCVVPYTRGRERSRSYDSILKEINVLAQEGFLEITLLGQNVNSYFCKSSNISFPQLLKAAADTVKNFNHNSNGLRIRFTTSHPRDLSDELIDVMAENDNICKHLHLPVQSGSNKVLELMNRGYNVEHYLKKIEKIRAAIPNIALTTDLIAGFPGEGIDDHNYTMELLKTVRYDGAFMFRYSAREGTNAFKYEDNVTEEEKIRRLNEIINLQQTISKEINRGEIGNIYVVLAEGPSKRSNLDWQGRTDTNKTVIFPLENRNISAGEFVKVKIIRSTAATLFGEIDPSPALPCKQGRE